MYITITFDAAMPTLTVRDFRGYTIKEDFFPSDFAAIDWMDDIADAYNIEWDTDSGYNGRLYRAHAKVPDGTTLPEVYDTI